MSGGVETAYAKLNLALHVRRRRDDGYHELETLFAFTEDGDRVAFEPAARWALAISGEFAGGLSATDPANLVLRAARAFEERFGGRQGRFALDKRLPVAAGIGGGSADAAAALRLLARAAGVSLADPSLAAIAAMLGADVPACLASCAVRGEARGEVLAPVGAGVLAGLPVLLVNPRRPLATGPVFANWDGIDRGPLATGDPLAAARAGRNDLAPPAARLLPEIEALVALLARQPGATLARMSGSGATCFALFEDEAARDAADGSVAAVQPGWWRLATKLR